jgi:hypothetical protein
MMSRSADDVCRQVDRIFNRRRDADPRPGPRPVRLGQARRGPLQAATGRELMAFRDLPEKINSLAFPPDDRHLAAAIHDSRIRVWHASPAAGR